MIEPPDLIRRIGSWKHLPSGAIQAANFDLESAARFARLVAADDVRDFALKFRFWQSQPGG
jgi:hypothetical protein